MNLSNQHPTRKPPRYSMSAREANEWNRLMERLSGCLARTDGPRARCIAAALKVAEQIAGRATRRAGAR